MPTQLHPHQVKGLEKAYEDIEKLSINTRGIKIAAWVAAISILVIAIIGIINFIIQLLK